MTNKKVIIHAMLLLIGFLGGYFIHSIVPNQTENLSNPYRSIVADKQELPECFIGRCPQYFEWDVNDDGHFDSVVVIPTAMTKGAGKVWVIDRGKVVFDSGELMQIWVEEPEDHQGFYLLYKTDINNPVSHKVKYIYKEGKFIPETR